MDDHEKVEEQQVEDLEIQEDDADDVRGGASPQLGPAMRAQKLQAGNLRSVDGGTVQHNETLVRI